MPQLRGCQLRLLNIRVSVPRKFSQFAHAIYLLETIHKSVKRRKLI